VHVPAMQESQVLHPQSTTQLEQSSQVGSHVPSPQAAWQVAGVPGTQFCVQGVHPQSPGQVLQSSQAGLQTPLPHVD